MQQNHLLITAENYGALRVRAMIYLLNNVDGQFTTITELQTLLASDNNKPINRKTAIQIYNQIVSECKRGLNIFRLQEGTKRVGENEVPAMGIRLISEGR